MYRSQGKKYLSQDEFNSVIGDLVGEEMLDLEIEMMSMQFLGIDENSGEMVVEFTQLLDVWTDFCKFPDCPGFPRDDFNDAGLPRPIFERDCINHKPISKLELGINKLFDFFDCGLSVNLPSDKEEMDFLLEPHQNIDSLMSGKLLLEYCELFNNETSISKEKIKSDMENLCTIKRAKEIDAQEPSIEQPEPITDQMKEEFLFQTLKDHLSVLRPFNTFDMGPYEYKIEIIYQLLFRITPDMEEIIDDAKIMKQFYSHLTFLPDLLSLRKEKMLNRKALRDMFNVEDPGIQNGLGQYVRCLTEICPSRHNAFESGINRIYDVFDKDLHKSISETEFYEKAKYELKSRYAENIVKFYDSFKDDDVTRIKLREYFSPYNCKDFKLLKIFINFFERLPEILESNYDYQVEYLYRIHDKNEDYDLESLSIAQQFQSSLSNEADNYKLLLTEYKKKTLSRKKIRELVDEANIQNFIRFITDIY